MKLWVAHPLGCEFGPPQLATLVHQGDSVNMIRLLGLLLFSFLLLSCGEMRFYQISGEECNHLSNYNGTNCQFSLHNLRILVQAYGGKKRDLSLSMHIEYLGSEKNLKFNPSLVEASVEESIIHSTKYYVNGGSTIQGKLEQVKPHETTMINIKFGEVPISKSDIVKISLGKILVGDSSFIELGKIEVDFTKYTIRRYM